jgi:hypothetical protein
MNQINHRVARKMINARLSLALPPSKADFLNRHLSLCPACQKYASQMQGLETRLRQELQTNARVEMTSSPETTQIVLNKLKAKSMKTKIRAIARAAVVSAGMLLLFLILSTPPGRAWAQNAAQGALRFFTRLESDSLPAPTEVPLVWVEQTPGVPAATPTPVPTIVPPFAEACGNFNTPRCSVEQIRDKVDFTVKELGFLPPGMAFSGATGGPDLVYMLYDTPNKSGSIQLFQEPWTGSASQTAWNVGPEAVVETVQIGDNTGEYVKGTFHYQAGEAQQTWDDQAEIQNLRWVEDGVYIMLLRWGAHGKFAREELVALAESLTTLPVAALTTPESIDHTPTPDPVDTIKQNHPLTVGEAEEAAGFKIFLPTRLPADLLLLGVNYDPERKVVSVFYSYYYQEWGATTNGLSISQEIIPPEGEYNLRSFIVGNLNELGLGNYPSGTVVGEEGEIEAVEIGEVMGQYVEGVWKGTECCGWVWEHEPYLKRMRWQANGMAYELMYMGLELSKQDLIEIAESMK